MHACIDQCARQGRCTASALLTLYTCKGRFALLTGNLILLSVAWIGGGYLTANTGGVCADQIKQSVAVAGDGTEAVLYVVSCSGSPGTASTTPGPSPPAPGPSSQPTLNVGGPNHAWLFVLSGSAADACCALRCPSDLVLLAEHQPAVIAA